jgi:hypothetical protein
VKRWVPRRDDHPVAGDPAQLGQPGGRIGPVVHRPDGHRRVEGRIGEREVLGRGLHRGRGARRALPDMTADGSTAVTLRADGS